VNYRILSGSGTLSAASSQTDVAGNTGVILQVNSFSAPVQVNVCVAPPSSVCRTFSTTVVPTSSLQLQAVAGTLQVVPPGQSFQPAVVRVVDSSSPPDAVLGASVRFVSYVGRMAQNQPISWAGEGGISQPGAPVILSSAKATVLSDINGLSSFPISTQGYSGNIVVAATATAGNSSVPFEAKQLEP